MPHRVRTVEQHPQSPEHCGIGKDFSSAWPKATQPELFGDAKYVVLKGASPAIKRVLCNLQLQHARKSTMLYQLKIDQSNAYMQTDPNFRPLL